MQIVIDISEEDFIKIFINGEENGLPFDLIRNGTPLPKGHGRLIDADALDITTITTDDYSGNEILDVILKEDIDDAPTIVEANKESD